MGKGYHKVGQVGSLLKRGRDIKKEEQLLQIKVFLTFNKFGLKLQINARDKVPYPILNVSLTGKILCKAHD